MEKQSYLRHKARHAEFDALLFFRIVLAYFKMYLFSARLKTWKLPKNFSEFFGDGNTLQKDDGKIKRIFLNRHCPLVQWAPKLYDVQKLYVMTLSS